MNKKKIDRGWVWETTKEETQWKAYECKVCRRLFMYPSNLEVVYCKLCEDTPLQNHGYVRRVREVK